MSRTSARRGSREPSSSHPMVAGALLALLGGAGCSLIYAPDKLASDAPDIDAATVDATVSVDASFCSSWSAEHFDPCGLPAPEALVLANGSIHVLDTDLGALVSGGAMRGLPSRLIAQSDGIEAMVLSVDGMTLGGGDTLRAIGSRPLIIASWAKIEIHGALRVDSDSFLAGAGANPATCATAAGVLAGGGGDGGRGLGGGEGGGGGGFASAGTDGGSGSDFGQGGLYPTAQTTVRGGCAGGHGGVENGGAGGAGGGAVQLSAAASVSISGSILAGGQGGFGGRNDHGGGGGGAGGYIGIEAPSIDLAGTAVIAANGGGGGSGADVSETGTDGQAGQPASTQALGGAIPVGGDGGLGGAADGEASTGFDSATGAGGGGGGGIGVVRLPAHAAVANGAVVSPGAVP